MKKVCLITILSLIAIQNCFAGWPVGKSRTIMGIGYNYYYSNKTYNTKWRLNDTAATGDYFRSNYISF